MSEIASEKCKMQSLDLPSPPPPPPRPGEGESVFHKDSVARRTFYGLRQESGFGIS